MKNEAKETLKSFSEELVALCRKHEIGSVDCTVNLDSCATYLKGINFGWGQFRLTWNEGRHGARGDVKVSYQTQMCFPEATPKDATGLGESRPTEEE